MGADIPVADHRRSVTRDAGGKAAIENAVGIASERPDIDQAARRRPAIGMIGLAGCVGPEKGVVERIADHDVAIARDSVSFAVVVTR